jgi:plastocyanin
MKTRPFIVGFLAVAAAAALLLAACSSGGASEDDLAALQAQVDALGGAPSVGPTERFIEVTGFELKGTTNTGDLAAPDIDPSTLSDGFGYKPPGNDEDNPTNWTVETYVWGLGSDTAFQGDKVNLHFFIINGNEHEVWIEGPDGSTVVDEIEMNRGREYFLEFEASQAGVYRLICNNHEPTMTAEIVVLPQS